MKRKILTGIAVGLSILTVSSPAFAETVRTNTGTRKVSDTTYDVAKNAFENIPAKVKAKNDLDKAEKTRTTATNNVNDINGRLTAKNSELSDLKNELSALKSELREAEAIAQKRKNWVNNDTDKIKNDAEYKALQTAENNLINIQSQVADKNKEITAAKEKVAEKENIYKEKQALYKVGSFAFFQWVIDNYPEQSDDAGIALDILNNNKYSSMIKKGEPYDSTSLDNMKKAIGFIRTSNKLRVEDEFTAVQWSNEGVREKDEEYTLYPLKIDHRCMAQSQVNAAYSSKNIGHSDACDFGENLAWGAGNMFNGLYYEEKEIFLKWQKDHSEKGETGHYINIIYSNYVATGAACKTDDSAYGFVYSQTYTGSSATGLSVDEYEKLFDKYCKWVDPERAKEELDTAKNELTSRQNELRSLQDKEAAAKKAKNEAQAAVDDLKDAGKLASAEKKVRDLNKKIDDTNDRIKNKEKELKTIREKLADAKKTLDAANADVSAKQKAYDEICKKLPTLESALLKRITDKDYTYLNKYIDDMLASKVGWKFENGSWKYYSEKDGKAYTGWHRMGKAEGQATEHWSYFGKDGSLYVGWKKMGRNEGEKNEHWSYFGDNGWLRTGWQNLGKGTKNPDGNAAQHWSYFGDNGWLRTGWVQFGRGTAEPDGNSAKHWSYFGSNGWLRTGWVQFGRGTAEPDGNSAKHWSYFGPNGWLRTGLQYIGQGTGNPDGNAAKHQSYFGDNGWLRTDQRLNISGVSYRADANGWLWNIK